MDRTKSPTVTRAEGRTHPHPNPERHTHPSAWLAMLHPPNASGGPLGSDQSLEIVGESPGHHTRFELLPGGITHNSNCSRSVSGNTQD